MSKIKKLNMVMVIVQLLLLFFNLYEKDLGWAINSFVWILVHSYFVCTLEE